MSASLQPCRLRTGFSFKGELHARQCAAQCASTHLHTLLVSGGVPCAPSRTLPGKVCLKRRALCTPAQVARSRHACMPAQEAPRDLAPAERAQLAALHMRRLTDVVAKQCGAVLKHVQNHKVGAPPRACCARCERARRPAQA